MVNIIGKTAMTANHSTGQLHKSTKLRQHNFFADSREAHEIKLDFWQGKIAHHCIYQIASVDLDNQKGPYICNG
jgi:hypothetical protein